MNRKGVLAFVSMWVIILVLLTIIIFRKPDPKPVEFNVKPLRDSIALLQKFIDQDKLKNEAYVKKIDSLNTLPPKIKIIYRAQKAFIPTASVQQLDSIIRTNIR
jgi:hypothetical protein